MNDIFPDSQIIRLPETQSTNSYLLQLSQSEKLSEGTVVVTDNQTAGRGQGNNFWESEAGANIAFSIILYPVTVKASEQFIISKVISLAVFDFISGIVENAAIKWPNDIYVGDEKIAGILIENFIAGENLNRTIAGIGININQKHFFSDAPNPVSLYQLTGKTYLLDSCLKNILACIAERYKMISERKKLDADYLRQLYRIGVPAYFCEEGKTFVATITGVNPLGMLELITEDGERKICKKNTYKNRKK